MFGRLFDERFRTAAAGIYAYAPVRLLMCIAVGSFVGLGAGWIEAGLWATAVLLVEALMLAATRWRAREDGPAPDADRFCSLSYLIACTTWSMAGFLLWSAPGQASHVAGAAFFAGHLLYIQAYHAHSPGAAMPALPATLIPAFTPLVVRQFTGVDQAIVCLAMAAVVGHSLISMWVGLTKSRQLMEAQAAMRAASHAKSAFLARMSHEIRTPLNGVLGMTQGLAAAPDLTTEHRKSLAVIRQSGESLLAILNDVLDLSKVEAGRLELETIAFDLADVVRGAQETFAPQAAAKGLTFHVEIDPEAAGSYLGDPTRVRQILYNLLANAVKFTEAGEVRLYVARGAAALEIVVADSGIGIPREHLPRLFSHFQQVDSSTTRRYGGSGLGLSICRELAELMGGSVGVESAPGEGSRFVVSLPLPRLGDSAASQRRAADPLEAGSGRSGDAPRILAAEDNVVNQLVLKTLLAQVGVEPDLVGDGQAAIEAWRDGAYDLILMDMQMPVLDGLSAVAAIRAVEAAEGRQRTPILALTANAMRHQVAEYLAAGVDGHVPKPIDAAQLFAAIAEALAAEPDAAAAVA